MKMYKIGERFGVPVLFTKDRYFRLTRCAKTATINKMESLAKSSCVDTHRAVAHLAMPLVISFSLLHHSCCCRSSKCSNYRFVEAVAVGCKGNPRSMSCLAVILLQVFVVRAACEDQIVGQSTETDMSTAIILVQEVCKTL